MTRLSMRSRFVLVAGACAGAASAVAVVPGTGATLARAAATQARVAVQHKASARRKTYYVSVGDSYSVGYQPGLGATSGYTGYVAKKTHLTLANFGCGGATTTSLISTVGCPDNLPHTAGAVPYPATTQAAAAEAFLAAHRGHIGLITVSISGNDVTSCATQASPITCVGAAVTGIAQNVSGLAAGLRAAAGPNVPLIGLDYPDVILGEYVYPSLPATPARIALAQESVVAFKSLINPALVKAYAAGQGVLVDVTAASGAYTPLTSTVSLRPYGKVPAAVAKVCMLTWFCSQGNIHATTKGYAFIGQLITDRYASLRRG
jgi:lysophospholipase L1-like esterase